MEIHGADISASAPIDSVA